jgi:hypothetical protein
MADLRIYLSPKGFAEVKKRVSPEDAQRLDAMVKEGTIKIVVTSP